VRQSGHGANREFAIQVVVRGATFINCACLTAESHEMKLWRRPSRISSAIRAVPFCTSVEMADVVETCEFAHSRAIWSVFRKVRLDRFSFDVNDRLHVGFGLPMSWSRPRDGRINEHVEDHIDEGQERTSRSPQPSLRRDCQTRAKKNRVLNPVSSPVSVRVALTRWQDAKGAIHGSRRPISCLTTLRHGLTKLALGHGADCPTVSLSQPLPPF
jgi:hypothetical protein